MALLRHTPTGDLYPYNADLACRDDMMAYTPPPEGAVETAVKVQEEEVVAPVSAKRLKDKLPTLDDL
jgi:hypothetical protein